MFLRNQFSIAFLSLFKRQYHDRSFIQITVDTSIRFHERAVRRKWYRRLTRISFSTLRNHENFRQMREVIRERACRENETRTRDGEGRKSRGNARREALGTGVHAYATISFDYIIVFRPGGIIHVNKLHIFFSFPIPSPTRHFFVLLAAPLLSFYCRDFVVVANSRRLFDPLSRFPFARRDARDTEPSSSFPDNPFADSGTGESL